MTVPPIISSFPLPGSWNLSLSPNLKRRLILSASSLLHPLIYASVFSEFDKILQASPAQREPQMVKYYAKLCSEWYQILTSCLEKNPPEVRSRLPFFERFLWKRIENKYIYEIEWYAECFADILNPDEELIGKIDDISDMMKKI